MAQLWILTVVHPIQKNQTALMKETNNHSIMEEAEEEEFP